MVHSGAAGTGSDQAAGTGSEPAAGVYQAGKRRPRAVLGRD